MKVLGLDIGDRKIGTAIADTALSIAMPGETIVADSDKKKLESILEIIESENIGLIVAGMPYNMKGEIAHQGRKVMDFIEKLKKSTGIQIETVDERLTSKCAGGGDDDSRAAALILETWLDRRNLTGRME